MVSLLKKVFVLLLLMMPCAAQILAPQNGGTGKSGTSIVHNLASALACNDSSGSGTTQVCNTSPTYTPAAGDWVIYKTTTTNTGDVTINVNSLGAAHVRKWLGSSVLAAGDLPSAVPTPMYYDGTYWEVLSIGNAPGGASFPTSATALGTDSGANPIDNTAKVANQTSSAPSTLTDGTTVTWSISSKFNANAKLTFTTHGGSRTLNLTGLVSGGNYSLVVQQDSSGTNEGLILGSGCTWKVSGGGSGAITTTTGANAIDVLSLYYDGTNCYANFNTNFN